MNLTRIKYFVDIVKHNSFTKAAHANYISQTAISQQMASLESELGIKLFDRSKKGITVTDAGKSFYENSMQILNLYARSVSVAKCIDQGLSGRIVLGVSPGMNNLNIHSAISELMGKSGDVHIKMRVGSPTDLKHMLKSMGINMAVALPYDFYPLPNVTIDPLITCGYSLLVSGSSPLAELESVSIDDIRNENIVVQGESLGELTFGRIVVEHMQNNHQITPTYIVDNLETLMLMVGTNQAVAILPDCMLFSGAYNIKKLKLLDYPEEVSYSIIWRPNISSPGLVSFVDILKEHFKKLQL